MRIRILAVSGALAASTLLAAPAMADDVPATNGPTATAPAAVATATPEQARAALRFRNSCTPTIAALPTTVEGQPNTYVPGAPKGVYIWHEQAGWRVRLTHPQADSPKLIEVWGRITSTRRLSNVRTIQLEDKQRGEWVKTRNRVMEFRFINGGFIDGINFTAGCSGRLGFTVWEVTRGADGKPVRDPATGKVVRTALPVFVGADATPVTAETIPALAAAPSDVSRVVIRRAPVS
jgi:hypothetical protein